MKSSQLPLQKRMYRRFPRLYLVACQPHGFGISTITALQIAKHSFAVSCSRSVYKIQHDMAFCLWLDKRRSYGIDLKVRLDRSENLGFPPSSQRPLEFPV